MFLTFPDNIINKEKYDSFTINISKNNIKRERIPEEYLDTDSIRLAINRSMTQYGKEDITSFGNVTSKQNDGRYHSVYNVIDENNSIVKSYICTGVSDYPIWERLYLKRRYPSTPQIDFTVTEDNKAKSYTFNKIGDTDLSTFDYTAMHVEVENTGNIETITNSEMKVSIGADQPYLSCSTGFLTSSKKLYWGGLINVEEGLCISRVDGQENELLRNTAVIASKPVITDNISEIKWESVSIDFPVGTNIKIWLK